MRRKKTNKQRATQHKTKRGTTTTTRTKGEKKHSLTCNTSAYTTADSIAVENKKTYAAKMNLSSEVV